MRTSKRKDDQESGQIKKSSRRTKASPKKGTPLTIANPNSAGIDLGSREHYVAVPVDRDRQPVRSFSSYTSGVLAMSEWLQACGITTVAMEATGSYWISVYDALASAGFEVLLVDARSIKHVPGRKSDVQDCQWIQQLHSYGLLRGAFRPDDEICRWRTLQRHHKNMVEQASKQVLHIQKMLSEMNLYLHHALSNIVGESGLRILDAILAGERDPKKLARLIDCRIQKSQEEVAESLRGNYRDEHLLVIRQNLEFYRFAQGQIAHCEAQILELLNKLQSAALTACSKQTENELGTIATAARRKKKNQKRTALEEKQAVQLKRILGIDLTLLPGLQVLAVLTLLSEIGTDMSRWRNEKAFASWLGLCPSNKVSGGKVLSSRSRKVVSRAAGILRVAAMVIGRSRSDSPLGSFYRRKQAQLGGAKANTATAHKLACLIYKLLRDRQEYAPQDTETYEKRFRHQMVGSLRKRAAKLGFDIVELSMAA